MEKSLMEKVREAANKGTFGFPGGFVNTDGEWCSTRNPEEFKSFLEKNGFHVTECYSKANTTAIAIVAEGYRITWNGFCRYIH